MGYKVYFTSYDEIMNYIDYQNEFLNWSVSKFNLTSSNNIKLNIDTTFNLSYTKFLSLKNLINQFYVEQGSLPITMDIKLICPTNYKRSIDPDDYYNNFYINFYSNSRLSYFELTYEEKGMNLIEEPYKSWVAYIISGYNKWKTYYSE